MSNKYQRAIAEIKASDELKEKIKMKLEQEHLKNVKKEGCIMKLKRGLIAISATLVTLVCSGAVYASVGGTINGIPVVEWLGIKFSPNYANYEQAQNQFIENEYAKIELQSTICDDGFAILKFNLKIKDRKKIREQIFFGDWTEEEMDERLGYMLRFNDILPSGKDGDRNYTTITNNNNLIINGKKHYINGSAQSINENILNEEYTIYQMWFLTDDKLKNKDKFTIELNNVALDVNGLYFKFKDSFKIELSKSKARKDTTQIKTNSEKILYKTMQKTLEEVKITPLQNIVKISTSMTGGVYDGVYYRVNDEQLREFEYVVTDQNGKEYRI